MEDFDFKKADELIVEIQKRRDKVNRSLDVIGVINIILFFIDISFVIYVVIRLIFPGIEFSGHTEENYSLYLMILYIVNGVALVTFHFGITMRKKRLVTLYVVINMIWVVLDATTVIYLFLSSNLKKDDPQVYPVMRLVVLSFTIIGVNCVLVINANRQIKELTFHIRSQTKTLSISLTASQLMSRPELMKSDKK
jgi:hypothetical protein